MSSLSQRGRNKPKKPNANSPKQAIRESRQKKQKRIVPGGTGRDGQWPPRPDRGYHHGPWWLPRPWWPSPSPVRFGFSAPLRLPAVFAIFFLYIACIWTFREPESTPQPFSFFFIRVQLSLERERKKGEDCKDSTSGLAIERRERVLDEQISSPSLFFSQSKFMFCNFALNLQFES